MVIKGMATWLSRTEPRSARKRQEFGRWRHRYAAYSRSMSPYSPCCSSWRRHRTRWGDRRVAEGCCALFAVRDMVAPGLAAPPLRGRPRFLCGSTPTVNHALVGGGEGPSLSLLLFSTGFSRALISVASRAIAPMMRPPSARSISAACICRADRLARTRRRREKTWLRKEPARFVPNQGSGAMTWPTRGARETPRCAPSNLPRPISSARPRWLRWARRKFGWEREGGAADA